MDENAYDAVISPEDLAEELSQFGVPYQLQVIEALASRVAGSISQFAQTLAVAIVANRHGTNEIDNPMCHFCGMDWSDTVDLADPLSSPHEPDCVVPIAKALLDGVKKG